MKRKSREFRPTALDGTHQLEERVVLSQFGAMQLGSFQQSQGISQGTINRALRDVNQAFSQLANSYSRSFNSALRTFDGTSRLTNGFNDNQVDLLNQRLLKVVSRLPYGVQAVGPDERAITESLRDTLNSLESVDRTSDRASVLSAAASARNAIYGAQAQVRNAIVAHTNDLQNGDSTLSVVAPPQNQSYRISQGTINRTMSDVNQAFSQLANSYSRSFNSALRTFDGTSRLTNGFNDNQVDLLNQRLVKAVSRLPYGVQAVGPDVVGIGDSLRDTLNSLESVNRASDRGSISFAAASARDAIYGTRAQVQNAIHDYIVSGAQDGSFVIR